MAVWEIPSDQIIDYSANGDDVDSFSQKVKFCIENIFECLQQLLTSGARMGLAGEARPYEIRINTADGCIYMRNADNTEWIFLGEVAERFGLTPETINAVRNGGGMKRLLLGSETTMPLDGNSMFDLYFAQDTSRVFIWLGSTWVKFLSLQFGDMIDYDKFCIVRSEATSIGGAEAAGKLIRVSSDGKLHVDIAGSTDKIGGVKVETTGITNGDVLQYDVVRNAFIPVEKDVFTEKDVSSTGEAGKLVRVAVDGRIHADIEGSATEIANVPVKLTGLREGDVLVYSAGTFVPVKKDKFDDASTTTTGEADKLVKVGEDGRIHADIEGSATEICTIPVAITSIDDGQILRYHRSTGTFRNEDPSAVVGVGKSLILRDGERVLGDYNGAETVNIDIQEVLNQSMLSHEVAHLMRLTENLYLALDAAALNPGGYDGLSGETFYGEVTDIDTTEVKVMSVISGDDSIDVDSIEGLIEGSHYILWDGTRSESVQIKHIIVESGVNRVIFYKAVTGSFTGSSIKLLRTTGAITEGEVSGDDVYCTANLIPFVNEATGETTEIRHAHLSVKHQNVADAEITAEIALRDGVKFVKGEVIGIGNGSKQTVLLAHTNELTSYKFALYFNGALETSDFEFSPLTGEVTFTAASGVIVSADYFYDWTAETFVEMTKTGTYPDRRDSTQATTQFTYDGVKGSVATIRLKLKRGAGTATNEIISSGTGKPRGFKLAHQAISGTVSVSPTPTSWNLNSAQNTVIVTSPSGSAIRISYRWKGKAFSVNSFACTFNE